MTATFCTYPWDLLDDPRATGRVREAGADGVAIAAAYHSVRAATPLHPRRAVVDAGAAYYLPLDDEVWSGSTLRPRTDAPWVGPGAFLRAARAAREAGLRVEAWLVLTHSTPVGNRARELTVQNVLGERYPYALCPAAPDVRDYARRLVAGVVRSFDVDGLMLEALGPLGVSHLGRHEKTQGADWTPVAENLLSICFCDACQGLLADHDVDVPRLRLEVRAGLAAEQAGHHGATEDHVSRSVAVLAARAEARSGLASAVKDACDQVPRVVVHAQPDLWATGPFTALDDAVTAFDGVVLPGHLVTDDLGTVGAVRDRLPGRRVGGYLSAMPPATPDSIRRAWPAGLARVDDAYVYHLGLLSEARLEAAASALLTRRD
ncbi:hypothetical protein [Krasilnikoviella flava]|uniref:Alanine-rich protein n=1 Tax=Krasilnikoviella flava TaxID=526729 RepID=A0A1T5LFP3_9MICO|nr:hypothetical protein [Krasilnikoviella flava]SKC74867.1 hypothetical protein SAMN04324258_3335 [Krasilnikoviella flava]